MTTVLTRLVARLLLAPTLVVGAAFLVKGYVDVGDGFAGGLVAALAVLLQYVALGRATVEDALPVHRAFVVAGAGLLIAVGVAIVPALAGGAPLEHAPPPGVEPIHVGSLELITAVVFDVGVFLLVLGVAIAIIHFIAVAGEEVAE